MKNAKLKASQPAKNWNEAYPLGNGRLGAMLFGDIKEEHIQLNQDSVWSCGRRNRGNPDALKALKEVRKDIFEGHLEKAEEEVYTKMLADPITQGHYEPLADVKLIFEKKIPHFSELFCPAPVNYSNYQRILDMDASLYQCSFEKDGISYRREAFISYPDQVMAIHIQASMPIGMRLELSRSDAFETLETNEDSIVLTGQGSGDAPTFACATKIISDGKIKPTGYYSDVSEARNIYVYIAGTTSFYEKDPKAYCLNHLDTVSKKGYDSLRAAHFKDVKALFERVELNVGEEDGAKNSIEQFYNFGRYLMIASSRIGSLPANLQGIWCEDYKPSWGSRYTLNINLEMNYWLAESGNLPECHMPLLNYIQNMIPQGKEVAKKMYGCRGAVAHHNSDIYGDCYPNDRWMPASLWPMGLGWLGLHLIEHYQYSKDKEFVCSYFDSLLEIATFYLDYLIPDKKGNLVTCPSTSPENTYILPNREKGTVCYGPAMDSQIIRELWKGLISIYEENENNLQSKANQKIIEEIKEKLKLLPKDKIGSKGQLLEWQEEYEEYEKGHRHLSHLFGLYPGHEIQKQKDFAIFNAAKASLEERLAAGGGATGWSRAWVANLWARLGEGDKAYESVFALVKELTAPNLFDLHPPLAPGMSTVFQIDGNFGAAAAINEMLVQTILKNDGSFEVLPLPALPKAWKEGYLKGVRVRGGKTLNIYWKDGKLEKLEEAK